MDENEIKINASFHFQSRLKGELLVELFNDIYINVIDRPLQRTRQFRLEVATLNPEAKHHLKLPYHWLIAALITAAVTAFMFHSLFSADPIQVALPGALGGTAICIAFFAMFIIGIERRWVIETRNALYPLIVIPYLGSQKKEAKLFITELQQAIEFNVQSKRYSNEDLFAGEMRMLRRLAKNKVLSETLYERAKAHMMRAHGSVTSA
ncbi:MAG: hypothetical protein OEZ16_08220 [Chromatiales bacterium]|nr:hypothetical protein [Chromatiales bacterium]